MVKGLRDKTYQDRVWEVELNVYSLKERREREDMTETSKR